MTAKRVSSMFRRYNWLQRELAKTSREWLLDGILCLASIIVGVWAGVYRGSWVGLLAVVIALVWARLAWRNLVAWRAANDYRGAKEFLRHQAIGLYRNGEFKGLTGDPTSYVVIPQVSLTQRAVRILCLESDDLYNDTRLETEGAASVPAVMYAISLNRNVPVIRIPTVAELSEWVVHEVVREDGSVIPRVTFQLDDYGSLGSVPMGELWDLLSSEAMTAELPQLQELSFGLLEAEVYPAG